MFGLGAEWGFVTEVHTKTLQVYIYVAKGGTFATWGEDLGLGLSWSW